MLWRLREAVEEAFVDGRTAQTAPMAFGFAGIRVPPGFCVTTAAFRRIMAQAPWIEDQLDRLSRLNPDDPEHYYDYRSAYRAGAQPDATEANKKARAEAWVKLKAFRDKAK